MNWQNVPAIFFELNIAISFKYECYRLVYSDLSEMKKCRADRDFFRKKEEDAIISSFIASFFVDL